MSIFNEAGRARRLAILHEHQASRQRLQQEQQTLQAQERERLIQISLLRQLPIAAIFTLVNTSIWGGKGRIRDYTHEYPVDYPGGHKVYPGEPIMVLEAGRRHRVEYAKYRYKHDRDIPWVIPYREMTHREVHTRKQVEPVILMASIKTEPFGAGTRDVLQLALGYGFEATRASQRTADVDTVRPEHSRNVSFYWEAEIPLSQGVPIASISQQIRMALVSGFEQVDPRMELFRHLVTLPEQPVGQRTPPPRYGGPIRKGLRT